MNKSNNIIEASLLIIFFSLLIYAGVAAYQSIDFKALDRLEKAPLVLPSPLPTTPLASPSAHP